MARDILVFAEQRDGKFKKSVLECINLARSLTDGGKVGAVLVGSEVRPKASELFAHGADIVYLADDDSLGLYNAAAYARAASDAAGAAGPALILFAATAMGRDLAPRVAARLGIPWLAEAMELGYDDDGHLQARKSMYGGKIFTTLRAKGDPPHLASVRPGAFALGEAQEGRAGEVIDLDSEIRRAFSYTFAYFEPLSCSGRDSCFVHRKRHQRARMTSGKRENTGKNRVVARDGVQHRY